MKVPSSLGPISPINWNCKIFQFGNRCLSDSSDSTGILVTFLSRIYSLGPIIEMDIKRNTIKRAFFGFEILQFQLTGEIGPWIGFFTRSGEIWKHIGML